MNYATQLYDSIGFRYMIKLKFLSDIFFRMKKKNTKASFNFLVQLNSRNTFYVSVTQQMASFRQINICLFCNFSRDRLKNPQIRTKPFLVHVIHLATDG